MKDTTSWEKRFYWFVAPFLEVWRTKKRRLWAPTYLRGLLLPGERKSVEPMASRVAPGHDQELRHFVSEPTWDAEPVEQVLWQKADTMLGGDDAVLIIDDTRHPKEGRRVGGGRSSVLRRVGQAGQLPVTGIIDACAK